MLEFDVPGNYNEDLNEDGFSIAKAKLTVKIRSGRARKGQAKFLLNLCDKNKPTVCSQQHVNDKTVRILEGQRGNKKILKILAI